MSEQLPMSRPPRRRYDCSQLLHAVSALDASLSEPSIADGYHADAPTVKIFVLGELFLMVAFTLRCCFVQEYSGDQPGTPLELCRFHHQKRPSHDEEGITCLTIVSLDDESLLLDDDEIPSFFIDVEKSQDSRTLTDPPTPHKSLLKGTMAGDCQCFGRVAVVLGTSASRVYSIELRFDTLEARLVMDGIPLNICEVLPADAPHTIDHLKLHHRTPFQPSGGVVSLDRFLNQQQETLVWIVYGDSCMIRIQSAALFPSVWQRGALTEQSVDEILGKPALLRCQVQLSSLEELEQRRIVPLPRAFPSLANFCVEPWKNSERRQTSGYPNDIMPEYISREPSSSLAASDQGDVDTEIIQAMVFSDRSTAPTLSFYTSELQFSSVGKDVPSQATLSVEKDVVGAFVGGTKALVGGMVGVTLSVFRFGPRNTAREMEIAFDDSVDVSMDLSTDACGFLGPFPTLWNKPVRLVAADEIHESPRKVEECSIAPDGGLVAVIDNLGRVLLIDLSTRQIVRIFKGYRDASVYWFHSKREGDEVGVGRWPRRPQLNLAIYCRQRRTLEMFEMCLGPPVGLLQVDSGAEVLPFCFRAAPMSVLTSGMLLKSSSNHIDKIRMDFAIYTNRATSFRQRPSQSRSIPPRRSVALRLQHLRQLLSTESVQFTADDVTLAMKAISSPSDLSVALDLLAESSLFETKLNILGSSFHKLAIDHCRQSLHRSINDDRSLPVNPLANVLSRKIQYHVQLIEAFDALFKFENAPLRLNNFTSTKDSNRWTTEALSWISVFEQAMNVPPSVVAPACSGNARFFEFALACTFPEDMVRTDDRTDSKLMIYFSDSSRTRGEMLLHVFRPLLCDSFSASTVRTIFEALGIQDDISYLAKCFGEWFLTLPLEVLRAPGLSAPTSPVTIFVQDLAAKLLERDVSLETSLSEGLIRLCQVSGDLIRSFVLATFCRNAVEVVSLRKERLTFGKILSNGVVRPWEVLLRKLRLCILISIKLRHAQLAAPLTVANLEADDIFSVYELVAIDLLSFSDRNDEILSLEAACSGSSYSFDASSEAGDDPARINQLQLACSSTVGCQAGVASSFHEEPSDVLLLFLPSYNQSGLLAAHRVRLLIRKWHDQPSELELIEQALSTLGYLSRTPGMNRLAIGVALDIWQSTISPLYRARLFGFDDVQQIDESVFGPLLLIRQWCYRLETISIQYLDIVRTIPWTDECWDGIPSGCTSSSTCDSWPNRLKDVILQGVAEKAEQVEMTAIATHISAICGLGVANEIHDLFTCVPALSQCFTARSLCSPTLLASEETKPARMRFVENAVVNRALSYTGAAIESFSLDGIELLCQIWEINIWFIHTLFLRCMYELGRDSLVDELTTKETGSFDVQQFIEVGVDIVCIRLHTFLSGSEMQAPDMRDTIGMLDADLCEWIQQRAKATHNQTANPQWDVPLPQSQRLALRLLGLCTSSRIDSALRIKIHSLTVLCGVLVNVIATRALLDGSQ